MENESLYLLKDLKDTVEKTAKESLVFHTEMRTSLIRIQEELKDLQRKRTEDAKDIEYIKESIRSHDSRFSYVYVSLVVVGFFIIGLLAR